MGECRERTNQECTTEYSEQCADAPREVCHEESTQECSTEYSEVCGTEYQEECYDSSSDECKTEFTEECTDVPECWIEQKEECHTVQVNVHHRSKPNYKKWKRPVVDGETVDSEVEEGEAEYDAGEDGESESRDERSIKP